MRLAGRTKRAEKAAAKAKPDDEEDDDEEETDKDRLEHETRELADQLRKAG